jgi:hypothetical protein
VLDLLSGRDIDHGAVLIDLIGPEYSHTFRFRDLNIDRLVRRVTMFHDGLDGPDLDRVLLGFLDDLDECWDGTEARTHKFFPSIQHYCDLVLAASRATTHRRLVLGREPIAYPLVVVTHFRYLRRFLRRIYGGRIGAV